MVVCGTALQVFVMYKRLDGYRTMVGDDAFDDYVRNDVKQGEDAQTCSMACLDHKVYQDFFLLSSLSIEASLASINLPDIFGVWEVFPPSSFDAPDFALVYAYKLTYSLGLSCFVVEYILKGVENTLNGNNELIKMPSATAKKPKAKKAAPEAPWTPPPTQTV